jgi:hypothetical protein
MGAINWQNKSPIQKINFTNPPDAPKSNYGGVPLFVQTSGVLPGTTPILGHTATPAKPPFSMKEFLSKIPSIISISHG